jgi:hypothetical protein
MTASRSEGGRATVADVVVDGWGPRWFRRLLAALALIYAFGVLSENTGCAVRSVVPRPLLYFMQTAKLFPRARNRTLDYRAEGWICGESRFAEIDVRPLFPIRADDKESRFDRALYFYRGERRVLRALEDYVVAGVNAREHDPAARIGGVRFVAATRPIPPPGTRLVPYHRAPLAEFPEQARELMWETALARRVARCRSAP